MDFRPLDPARLPAWRRGLFPLASPVARLLRWLWSRSGPSRSTWFDSRRWRAVWNVDRFFFAIPRAVPTTFVCRFDAQLCMELDLSRLTDVLAFLYGPGEIEVAYTCRRLVPSDGVVADIGGNIGTTTLPFAAAVPRGRVHVFEPSAAMRRCLERNLELSRLTNVRVHAYGLSDAPSRGRLVVAVEGNPGSAFFVAAPAGSGADAPEAAEHGGIDVRRLDDVLADEARLDFVKIDVEGHELHVLRGAAALLQRHRPSVLLEINEGALQRAGTSGREVCRHLLSLGYRLYFLERGRFVDYDLDVAAARRMHNVIAVHPARVPDPNRWTP